MQTKWRAGNKTLKDREHILVTAKALWLSLFTAKHIKLTATMPRLRRKFDFGTDYSKARPVAFPRPFGGFKEERALQRQKAGKRIALGEEKTPYETAAQSDYVNFGADTLAKKAGSVDTFTSNMKLTWEAPEGTDDYPKWETTNGAFDSLAKSSKLEQLGAVVPITTEVHWEYGNEKRNFETAFRTDFPKYDKKYIVNPYSVRTKGPKLATMVLGEDPNPEQYLSNQQLEFVYNQEEVDKVKQEQAKPNRTSKIRLGDKKLHNAKTWETAASADYLDPTGKTEKFKKFKAAVDVKKSTVKLGDDGVEYISNYNLNVGKVRDASNALQDPVKPNQTKSTVKIGDGVTQMWETAARSDYRDFSKDKDARLTAARPRITSCINLGEDKNVLWQTVDRDRIDPRTVPGAYIPTERTGAAVRPKYGEKAPNRVMLPTSDGKDEFVSLYQSFYTRGNEDAVNSKRESSRPKKGGRVVFGEDGNPNYETTYVRGSGKELKLDEIPTMEELQAANVDTSKSSVKIHQNEETPYETTNALPQYDTKTYIVKKAAAAVDVKKTSVKFGDEQLSYDTASKSDYLAFRFDKNYGRK